MSSFLHYHNSPQSSITLRPPYSSSKITSCQKVPKGLKAVFQAEEWYIKLRGPKTALQRTPPKMGNNLATFVLFTTPFQPIVISQLST